VGLLIVLSLGSTFFSGPGLFSRLIQFVLWSVIVKYSFESLKFTAEGHFKPPPLNNKILVENYDIVFKQIALYFALMFFFMFVVLKAGIVPIISFTLFCAIGLPAMLIILIINEDLGQALNPVMVVGIIYKIGWSYLSLLFFLMLLSGAPTALGFAVIQYLPAELQTFMIILSQNYYTIITYHLMGYVILQYHNRLDYPVELDTILSSIHPNVSLSGHDSKESIERAQHDDLLKEVELWIQEGELDKAIDAIEQRVQIEKVDDLKLLKRYFGLLKMQKRDQKLLTYAPHYLRLIVKTGSKSLAVEFYMECLRIDKTFSPDGIVLFKVASWLTESGKHKEAIFALNSLIKYHPDDPLVPKAHYRAAQIFRERLNDVDRAKQILNGMVLRYPDLEITAFAKNYLGNL
jgi:tetratricopeptide (TPR) repeat protein